MLRFTAAQLGRVARFPRIINHYRYFSQLATLKDRSLFKQQSFINGEWVDANNGATYDVKNPATGEIIGKTPKMGHQETKKAITAASEAFSIWKAKSAAERGAHLRAMYDLMIKHKEDLGLLLTLENGKPLKEAMGEIQYAAHFLEWFGEESKRIYGDMIPAGNNFRVLTIKQPVGVVAAITPWNFPAAMLTRKVGAALAAGCTVVCKPSELTPFSAFALGELAIRAGIPKGVLNILTGEANDIGKEMTSNPLVKKITFTGSTRVGKLLMRQAADTVKRVSLELGGNAPFIIFNDANLEQARDALLAAKFRNCGQTCVTPNRIIVQADICDRFAAMMSAAMKKLVVGNGLLPDSSIGPLINSSGLAKVESQVKDAIAKGAHVVCGGQRLTSKPYAGGCFYAPTLLTRCTQDMLVFKEETFGPVLPIFSFHSEEDAIRMANNTSAGLASYCYTRDSSRLFRVCEQLDYGMVGANFNSVSYAPAPFGGVKESGLGREGSKYGIDEYVHVKTLSIGL
eukprot:TRINITY_DN4531_c0_g1_i1.p1 TRINITY_DN4531_c0_g1~~TRINITY_DN4531_c0_g1_i1.p1  ORF type:complete len:514 (+),score=81.64 TRINITY_DN4531_c0_g1_i1:102-1643(+)